ncbi:20679_t:CDS:1, partial [Gigaspora margarita]
PKTFKILFSNQKDSSSIHSNNSVYDSILQEDSSNCEDISSHNFALQESYSINEESNMDYNESDYSNLNDDKLS